MFTFLWNETRAKEDVNEYGEPFKIWSGSVAVPITMWVKLVACPRIMDFLRDALIDYHFQSIPTLRPKSSFSWHKNVFGIPASTSV